MLYIAKHWKRDAYGWETGEERICATKRTAELWAKSVLGSITVTNGTYHRDLRRADHVSVYNAAKVNGKHVPVRFAEQHLPDVIIVPSVGELGWTP